VIESRKQALSIRVSAADVRKMKKLAQRLGARESDVIRFAVKCMLARLSPLYDSDVKGRNLVPVFVESGSELLRFFDLDSARLDGIINDGVEPSKRVDRDDIALLAMSGAQAPYAALMLNELNAAEDRNEKPTDSELSVSLRQYLYEKYVYRGGSDTSVPAEPVRLAVAGGQHE
jgi:hypothetical protein